MGKVHLACPSEVFAFHEGRPRVLQEFAVFESLLRGEAPRVRHPAQKEDENLKSTAAFATRHFATRNACSLCMC